MEDGRRMRTKIETLEPVTNGAAEMVEQTRPYEVTITVRGTAALLLHAWNIEAIEEKTRARKGSKEKKSDNLESYVYRTENGEIALKGDSLRASISEVARYHQDPRSPRKSARDLFKAGLVPMAELVSLGVKDWDFVARHRAVVQRSAITRSRPALCEGWRVSFPMLVLSPEYITQTWLQEMAAEAGRLQGLGDYRPTYGRYGVVGFEANFVG